MAGEIEDLKSRLSRVTPALPSRVEIDELIGDPLQFLASMPLYPKFLFSYRDQNKITAGCGAALRFNDTTDALRALAASGERATPCFATIPFFPSAELTEQWRAFDSCNAFLPSISAEISEDGDRVSVIISVDEDTTETQIRTASDKLKEIVKASRTPRKAPTLPKISNRIDTPDDTEFKQLVEDALSSIQSGGLSKVVVARQTTLEFNEKLDPMSLFAALHDAISADVYSFLFQPDSEHAFIGFSPERLLKIENGLITTEAVAGTAPSDCADALLTSEKDIHENRIVVDFLEEALAKSCSAVEVDSELSLKSAGSVSHLCKEVAGRLDRESSMHDVLSALHPTPAVCGTPRNRAYRFIRDNEPFERGLYAGAVGLIGAEHSELSVAIRSLLVHGNTVSLFAGAGIVDGSDPDSELREVESKIATYLRILGIE